MLKFCASVNLFWHMKFEVPDLSSLIQSKLKALLTLRISPVLLLLKTNLGLKESRGEPLLQVESWVFIEILF